jgi:hypothetical protein
LGPDLDRIWIQQQSESEILGKRVQKNYLVKRHTKRQLKDSMLEGWVAKLVACLLVTASSLCSNPDITLKKSDTGDISEGVANTLWPAKKKIYIKDSMPVRYWTKNLYTCSKQCGGSGMFIPDPGSRIRLFSIPDPGSELSPSRIPDPGSSSKNLSILTPKKAKNGF